MATIAVIIASPSRGYLTPRTEATVIPTIPTSPDRDMSLPLFRETVKLNLQYSS